MTKEKKTNEKSSYIYTAKLLCVVIAAFVTALFFRRSAGIIAMTPIALIICFAVAFIGIDAKLKLLIFGITVFTVNTVEQSDMTVVLTFTTLCLLFCIIANLSVKLLKQRKKIGCAVLTAGTLLCVALNVIFIGNPITAISEKSILDSYTDTKYPNTENAALGEFKFTSIYYDFRTDSYNIDAVSSKYPTEGGIITTSGGSVYDSFESIMEEKISEPYVVEITALLREYFPDDSFAVVYDDIAAKRGESVLASEDGALYGNITFEITVGGVQTANAMSEKVERYIRVIDDSGIGYARIIFKSGINPWVRRSVTVDSNRPEGFGEILIEHVPAGTSNRFNRYISEFTGIH